MSNSITCPSCQSEFEVSEVMAAQLTAQIRGQLESELANRERAVRAQSQKLESERRDFDVAREDFDQLLNARLESERKELVAAAQKSAEDQLASSIRDRDEQLAEVRAKLQEAQSNELELRKKERALEDKAKELELDVARQIDVERSKLEEEVACERRAVVEQAAELEVLRTRLEQEQQDAENAIHAGIEEERNRLLAEAQQAAEDKLATELSDRDEQLAEVREKLRQSQTVELELRKRERALEDRASELELEVARTLDVERTTIRDEALRQADEQHRLKSAEKEQQIAGLRKQIDELKRKAEQGSQQLQGEVQELDIESQLADRFPLDDIDPVGKGRNGGDTLQTVRNRAGAACGSIVWESKRTKRWQDTWLAKLREDQRVARADCAVIVSDVLPDGVTTFEQIDGIWVCSRQCVVALAAALRAGLIEVSKVQRASSGRQEKAEVVYSYLCSSEFKHHVSGIVESFIAMKADLDSEIRSTKARWKKREKQLDCVVTSTAGMYGDLQGIVGTTLPTIEGLEVPALELAAAS